MAALLRARRLPLRECTRYLGPLFPHLHKKEERKARLRWERQREEDGGTPEDLLNSLKHVNAASTHSLHYVYILSPKVIHAFTLCINIDLRCLSEKGIFMHVTGTMFFVLLVIS